MGNRAKRVHLAQELKKAGLGRLYKGNKWLAWRYYRSHSIESTLNKIQYKPGDVVHDCDGYNHVIKHWRTSWPEWWPNFWALQVDQFESETGYWSCGCPGSPDPACTPEAITAYFQGYINDPEMAQWIDKDRDAEWIRLLKAGEPIVDERGVRLP